jgi:hypothetical protein
MKIVEGVAKIAGECLIMEREKRPEMIDVVERLRVLRKALQQDRGQNRLYLLSWVSKSKRAPPAVVTILPSLCRQACAASFHLQR